MIKAAMFQPLGVDCLKQYRTEVDVLEQERQDLASAEQMFDLPITMYPELLQLQKDMKGLDQIYTLYDEQRVSLDML